MIRFSTLSGVLEAKRDPGGRVVLDLPLNPPQPVPRGELQALVDIASCGLPVQEVRLCGTTRKMLIRLDVNKTKFKRTFYEKNIICLGRCEAV